MAEETTVIGNVSYVRDQLNDLIDASQKSVDVCDDLKNSYSKIKANWDETQRAENYMTKLDTTIDRINSIVYAIDRISDYVNKYIDDSIATSGNGG